VTDIVMPHLSDSMDEGTIVRWLKAEGDDVAVGDELVEIETDKATMVWDAEAAGVLSIAVQDGITVAVGTLIARLGAGLPSDLPSEPEPAATGGATHGEQPAAPVSLERVDRAAGTVAQLTHTAPGRFIATPVARRLAREHGLELSDLRGSGPLGRITKRDALAAIDRDQTGSTQIVEHKIPLEPAKQDGSDRELGEPMKTAAPEGQVPAGASSGDGRANDKGGVEIRELTRAQQIVARRMAESKATAPDFSMTVTIDMDGCWQLSEQIKQGGVEADDVPSINDMVIKACAVALREHPRVNASYRDGRWELYERVNVGTAVGGADTLFVATVFDADRMSLGAIARDTKRLIAAVRDGTIAPSSLSSGTFTVSNLGMYGISHFSAVVNPPQAAILAVGAIERRPVVCGESVVIGRRMDATLVADHRVLDGVAAAKFVRRIRDLLEAPLGLVL
jgi:pyruvate dehydrogenase E2 component (dihydrolipoamide acetyltransferase)